MKKYLSLICLLALWISGCSQEDVLKDQSTSAEGRIFTTSFDYDGSRTYLEEGRFTRWTEDDRISLFDGNTLNRQYRFNGKTGDQSGSFSIVEKPFGTGMELSTNYAIYPYTPDVKITENGVLTTSFPSQQTYAPNSFGLETNTMVAVTHNTYDTFLNFKNAGGCLKLQLYGNNVTVKSITITGNNKEKLAGKANIIATYGEAPITIMTNEATGSITLNCGEEGIKVGTTAETATAFWIAIPPTVFEKGINIKVKEINGKLFTQSTENKIEVKRKTIKPMAALEVKGEMPYLTFTANKKQTLQMSKAVATLEYSVNDGEWKTLGTNTVTFGGSNGNLRLRGKNPNGTSVSYSDCARIKFGNNEAVYCKGDIRTLLDYENYETANTKNARFISLFERCTNLISAPELPVTDLASSCYKYMFYYCKNLANAPELPATILTESCYFQMFGECGNLTKAPELPATTLSKSCYALMFSECTSLINAPKLPATTLAESCYSNMFYGCSNLVNAPELPATTLAESCYALMFSGCTGLVNAPKLPATNLAKSCYSNMFNSCNNLVNAPTLPATTLAEGCYQFMFYDCKKLNNITMLATDIKASNSLYKWVYNIASTGTFIKAKDMESLPSGDNGIPKRWTVKDY